MEVAANDLKDLVLECARLREERDALRLRLAEVERERDAAVAAERERCAAWARRNFHAGDTVLDIESGAPAPREG